MVNDSYFLQVFKTSPVPTLILFAGNPDYPLISCNDSFLTKLSGQYHPGISLSASLESAKFGFSNIFYERLDQAINWVIEQREVNQFEYLCIESTESHKNSPSPVSLTIKIVPLTEVSNSVVNVVIYFLIDTNNVISDYQFLIKNLGGPVLFVDRNLKIISFNDEFSTLYQTYFGMNILIGDSVLEKARPEQKADLQEIFNSVFEGKIREQETEFTASDHSVINLLMHYKPVFDFSGMVMGAFVTIVDITERERSIQMLKDSEKKYRYLFQFSPLPQWIYEVGTFKITDVNETAIKHYGYSREEFLSMTLLDIRPEAEIHKLIEAHQDVDSMKGPRSFGIFIHRKKNGELIRVEVTAYRFDSNGRKYMMAIYNDVTDKYNAFYRLKESEAKLKASEKMAQVGYFELSNNTKDLYWSDEIFNIWQLDPLKFKPDFEYILKHIHPDDRKAVVKKMMLQGDANAVFESEHRIILEDGTLKWVRLKGFKIIKDGKIDFIEGTLQDITKSKLEVEQLLLNEIRYEYMMEATSEAIWDWELISDKIHLGKGFQTQFGYKVDGDISGHEFWKKNVHSSDYERVTDNVNVVTKRFESIWRIEYKLRKNNGDYAYVLEKGILIRNEENEITRMLGVIQDISIEKNRELQKSLIADLSLTFSDPESSLLEVLNKFLKRVISFGNFSLSEFWMVNEDKSKFNLFSKATIHNDLDIFYTNSSDFVSFASGEGIPGKTFQTGTNQTFYNIYKNPAFIRHDAAKKAGLVTAYAFPVKVKDEVIGVFVLGLRADEYDPFKIAALDENFLKLLSSEIERKMVHDELKESENRYSDLFHLNPEPMWVYDMETFKFLDVNKSAIEQYGYSREEFLSMTIKDIRPKEDIPLFEEAVKWSREHRDIGFGNKFRHLKKDGSILIVEIKNNTIRFQGRDVKLILAHNITERVNYIKAIEEQNVKLNEISWMHSHIVRAPVSKLMGLIDVIRSTSPDDKLREELFGYILDSAKELDEVTRRITEKAEEIHLEYPEVKKWIKD